MFIKVWPCQNLPLWTRPCGLRLHCSNLWVPAQQQCEVLLLNINVGWMHALPIRRC